MSELLQGLLVVRDAVQGLQEGRRHQAIALSAQLRALLLEKRKDSLPLLISVMDDLGLSQTLFAMPSEWPDELPEMMFRLSGPPFTRSRVLPRQIALDLSALEEHPVVEFEKTVYSVGDIVRLLANKGGGAHYAKALPEDFARMLELGAPDVLQVRDALLNMLIQLGEVVYEVGSEMLKNTSDLEVLMDLCIATRSTGAFVDFVHPTLPMRLTVGLTNAGRLAAEAVGIDGTGMGTVLDDLLDWDTSHHIRVRVAHNKHMGAELELLVDGGRARASSAVDLPVFLPASSIEEFDMYLNGANPGNSWAGGIAVSYVGVRSAGPPAEDARALLSTLGITRDADRAVVLYPVGAHGHSPTGERDIRNSEGVVKSRMSSVCSGGKDEASGE